MNKNIPPATETFRDSKVPSIGMFTSSQAWRVSEERPFPSLPNTKHRDSFKSESASSLDSEWIPLDASLLLSGWPAIIFISYLVINACRSCQVPETIGSCKEAPRAARRAFSLKGSQQAGRRNTPSCWHLGIQVVRSVEVRIVNNAEYLVLS